MNEAIDSVIDKINFAFGGSQTKMTVEFDIFFLGFIEDSELFEVQIKAGAEFGWLYQPVHVIVFDLYVNRGGVSGSKRFYVNRLKLKELAERELAEKKTSTTKQMNRIVRSESGVVGYISLDKVLAL